MFFLGRRSLRNLNGVDKRLVAITKLAIQKTTVDFTVVCGLRTKEEQEKAFREGKSQTLNSKHLTGRAVDILVIKNGEISEHVPDYQAVAEAMKNAAKELGYRIGWAGDWTAFRGDWGHFQLETR